MKAKEPFKIIFLMDDFRGPSGGGTERQFLNLLESIDRERFQPEIVVFRGTDYLKESDKYNCSIQVLNIHKILSLRTVLKMLALAKRIRDEEINLVQIYFNDASIIAPLFCRLGGAKVIVSRRDMGFWYTKLKLFCLYISNMFVDQIIANSYAVRTNVNKKEKYNSDKISVIYNGIDENAFKNITVGTFRANYGIDKNDPVIGMVANLDQIKRHADLIKAFSIVVGKYRNARLVFAGEGPEKTSLRDLAVRMNLADRIYFLGNLDNVLSIIADMDVCVLCSESEGLSNAVIEYMGCAKPIICTNTGGNPELITNGYNGYLVDVRDADAIARKLELLLSDYKLMREMGNNGYKRFKNNFGIEKMVQSHMNLYSGLLNEKQNRIGRVYNKEYNESGK